MVFSYILALCRSSSSKNLKKWQIIWTWATISFKIFWDFLMFYQIFLSPQVKRWVIITCKHGIYELSHELPNEFERIKVLLILAENSWKTEIKPFPFPLVSHENKGYSKYFVSYCRKKKKKFHSPQKFLRFRKWNFPTPKKPKKP